MRNVYIVLLLVLALAISGCTKLSKALLLRKYGQNQEMQDLYVRELDDKFEKMLEVYHAGQIKAYSTKAELEEEFGNPLIVREQVHNGMAVETLLYRYHTKPFGSDKLYFYINHKGEIVDHKFVKSIPKKDRKYNIFGIFKKDDG